MRFFYWGIFFIILGILIFAISIYQGEGGFALFLIFPVLYSTGVLGLAAIVVIFIGFFLIFISPFHEISRTEYRTYPKSEEYKTYPVERKTEKEVRMEKHYGGVILVGPIPVIFGSNKNMAIISILAAILILVAVAVIFILLS